MLYVHVLIVKTSKLLVLLLTFVFDLCYDKYSVMPLQMNMYSITTGWLIMILIWMYEVAALIMQ